MPSLKDIKTQINSVVSTKKITTAMKMVAASKLRRSQEKAVAARPYSSRLEEMLSSLASSAASGEGIIKLLTGTGNDQNYIVVPVSADRGLCGGFNSSINRETFKLVKSLEPEGKKVQLMPVGKKIPLIPLFFSSGKTKSIWSLYPSSKVKIHDFIIY